MKQFIHAESVELLHSGNEFFDAAKKIIDEAKEVIHLQTYIFKFDKTGKEIGKHLINAAKRGVQVYVLPDRYGSKELPPKFIDELKSAGIHFRFFSPLFSTESISIARRIHHKILVADKHTVLIGGINIGDKYHGSAGVVPWLDFAVMVKGTCNQFIHNLCESIYKKNKRMSSATFSSGKIDVRYRINDWYKRKNEIYYTYKRGFATSKKSISIVACYFLPGYFFLRRIKNVAKRGVKIKIVVGGISDIPMFHHAEKYLYDYLLRNGIEIYEWTESVMHGKAAVFDEKWCTIGSYNLNNLSKYQCMEMNVDIDDPVFSKKLSDDLDYIIHEKCTKITSENTVKQRNFFYRIKLSFAYYWYKLFMYLMVPKD